MKLGLVIGRILLQRLTSLHGFLLPLIGGFRREFFVNKKKKTAKTVPFSI